MSWSVKCYISINSFDSTRSHQFRMKIIINKVCLNLEIPYKFGLCVCLCRAWAFRIRFCVCVSVVCLSFGKMPRHNLLRTFEKKHKEFPCECVCLCVKFSVAFASLDVFGFFHFAHNQTHTHTCVCVILICFVCQLSFYFVASLPFFARTNAADSDEKAGSFARFPPPVRPTTTGRTHDKQKAKKNPSENSLLLFLPGFFPPLHRSALRTI